MVKVNSRKCIINTTRQENIEMAECPKSLSGLEDISALPCPIDQPYLCGEISKMIADKLALIAQYLETNPNTDHQTLSERQTPLLISAGLVRGTTLSFGRRLLNRGIPAGVLYAPDGSVVDIPRQVCIF